MSLSMHQLVTCKFSVGQGIVLWQFFASTEMGVTVWISTQMYATLNQLRACESCKYSVTVLLIRRFLFPMKL
jgi:hypothetical protein